MEVLVSILVLIISYPLDSVTKLTIFGELNYSDPPLWRYNVNNHKISAQTDCSLFQRYSSCLCIRAHKTLKQNKMK